MLLKYCISWEDTQQFPKISFNDSSPSLDLFNNFNLLRYTRPYDFVWSTIYIKWD